MTLDDYFRIGVTVELGSHLFTAEDIVTFARKYDPQPFHIDEEAARHSVFGCLCASGWHTAAVWMKLNIATPPPAWTGEGTEPIVGPSPGFRNLRWLKPVRVGDRIAYTRTSLAHRAMPSRPGWRLLTGLAAGVRQDGETVISFDTAVLVQTG